MGEDLGYAEEKQIYDMLYKAYKFPDWIVVWRSDKEKATKSPSVDTWYYPSSGFDFEIYYNRQPDGSFLFPNEDQMDDMNPNVVYDILKTLSTKKIVAEAKGRELKEQYDSIRINNKLHPDYRAEYGENNPPPKDTPTNVDGKLNKIIRLLNENDNQPFYYINKDKKKHIFYVIKFSKHLVDRLLKQDPDWDFPHNPGGKPTWEKNYEIFWGYISKWTGGHLEDLFQGDKPITPVKPIYEAVKKKNYVERTTAEHLKVVKGSDMYYDEDEWEIVDDGDSRVFWKKKPNEIANMKKEIQQKLEEEEAKKKALMTSLTTKTIIKKKIKKVGHM
jgi:hypothetical protein